MPAVIIRLTISACLLAAHATLFATACQADLFSHCFGTCQPQLPRPWSVSYPNSATTCFVAGSSCNPATPTVLQHQLLNFAPQTTYRTRWTTVPVTSYRPITTTDPVTGCTVTRMLPCMTYQWQARRVPVTTLRPVHSTIAVNTAPLPIYHAQPTTILTAPGQLGCGTEAPYYGTPATQFPATQFPATQVPGTQMIQPATPAGPSGSAPAGLPSGSPADRPPTLDPRRLQGATSTNPYGVRLIPPVTDVADERVPDRQDPISETQVPETQVPETQVRETQVREVPATTPVTTPPLQPIPDPDELNLEPATGSPRASGRDKVAGHGESTGNVLAAMRAGGGRVVPISWPAEAPLPTLSFDPPAQPKLRPVLDDTGWTSVRP